MSKLVLTAGAQNQSDGVPFNGGGSKQGGALVSQVNPRYYENTLRGRGFGIVGGLTTTTAAGAATFTGLAVGNPSTSGKNLALTKCFASQGAALTAETEIGIMYGPATLPITASLTTIFNRNASGGASVCTATAGQTITAPLAFYVWSGSGSGAITVPGIIPVNGIDFEGGIVIPPGYFFASYTSRVTTTALVFTFNWEEIVA